MSRKTINYMVVVSKYLIGFCGLVFLTQACSSVPENNSNNRFKVTTPQNKHIKKTLGKGKKIQLPKFFGSRNKCKVLATWVKPLQSKYPKVKFSRGTEVGLREKYKFLFSDAYFVPIFGMAVDSLNHRQLKSIGDALNHSNQICEGNNSPDVQFLLSLYPGSILSRPFNRRLKNTPFSYKFVVSHAQSRRRNIATSISKKTQGRADKRNISKHQDLGGTWSGTAKCFGGLHSIKLSIKPDQFNKVIGYLSIEDAGEKMQNLPLEFKHLDIKHLIGRDSFRVTNKGSGLAKFRRRNGSYKASQFWFGTNTSVFNNKSNGMSSITIKPTKYHTCEPMNLVRVPAILGIDKSDNIDNFCYTTLMWLKRGRNNHANIERIQQRYPNVGGYRTDLSEIFYYTIFSDQTSKKWLGTPLSRLSDQSVKLLLNRVGVCQEYSGRKKQLGRAIGDSTPFITDVTKARQYNRGQGQAKAKMDALVRKAKIMEDSRDNVKPYEKLLTNYLEALVHHPDSQYFDYYRSLAERGDAMARSVILADKHGLSRLPKLPLKTEDTEKVTPDDAVVPTATDEDLEEASKPVIIK